jgi:S-formylglutathione hydrolase FrmB
MSKKPVIAFFRPRWTMPAGRTSALVALLLAAVPAPAHARGRPDPLVETNQKLHGHVLDLTHNHGLDNRIWSPALCEKRDLYVYLPPCYDPTKLYPAVVYLHAFTQDEQHFLKHMVVPLDAAMAEGRLPPAIVVVPDGSIRGRPSFFSSASFFANSDAGRFEDYLVQDVWCWFTNTFPIRPEREAHVLVGGSMGGAAAYMLAIKHPDCFATAVGIFPALHLRYEDCHGRYSGPYDPCCLGYRTRVKPWEVVGRFYGVVLVKYKTLIDPLFGRGPDALDRVSGINPYDLLEAYDVRGDRIAMYAAYGAKDEFNCGAQVEAFAARARARDIPICVVWDPDGRHNTETGLKLLPGAVDWLAPRLRPFAP